MVSCCGTFGESLFYSRMTMHRHTVLSLQETGKLKMNFLVWPGQFRLWNRKENVWWTIKLKLQSETGVITMQAQLIDAVCRIWKLLSVHYNRSLYATIPHRLHLVNVGKGFPTKYWPFKVIFIFYVKKVKFFLFPSILNFVRCRHVGY